VVGIELLLFWSKLVGLWFDIGIEMEFVSGDGVVLVVG